MLRGVVLSAVVEPHQDERHAELRHRELDRLEAVRAGQRRPPQVSAQQLNPLLPGYSFNLYLVAGLTPIERARAFMDLSAKLLANPYQLAQTQMNMMWDYFSLWQGSMMKMMGMPHAQPVAVPQKGDKRFKDEDWRTQVLFDFSYLDRIAVHPDFRRHGVGRALHEEPTEIAGYFEPHDRRVLREGAVHDLAAATGNATHCSIAGALAACVAKCGQPRFADAGHVSSSSQSAWAPI